MHVHMTLTEIFTGTVEASTADIASEALPFEEEVAQTCSMDMSDDDIRVAADQGGSEELTDEDKEDEGEESEEGESNSDDDESSIISDTADNSSDVHASDELKDDSSSRKPVGHQRPLDGRNVITRTVFKTMTTNKAVLQHGEELKSSQHIPAEFPQTPMVELLLRSNVWYQGYVCKESANEVKVRIPGVKGSKSGKYEWLKKASNRVWTGSYKVKDWRYLSKGSWEPVTRGGGGGSGAARKHAGSMLGSKFNKDMVAVARSHSDRGIVSGDSGGMRRTQYSPHRDRRRHMEASESNEHSQEEDGWSRPLPPRKRRALLQDDDDDEEEEADSLKKSHGAGLLAAESKADVAASGSHLKCGSLNKEEDSSKQFLKEEEEVHSPIKKEEDEEVEHSTQLHPVDSRAGGHKAGPVSSAVGGSRGLAAVAEYGPSNSSPHLAESSFASGLVGGARDQHSSYSSLDQNAAATHDAAQQQVGHDHTSESNSEQANRGQDTRSGKAAGGAGMLGLGVRQQLSSGRSEGTREDKEDPLAKWFEVHYKQLYNSGRVSDLPCGTPESGILPEGYVFSTQQAQFSGPLTLKMPGLLPGCVPGPLQVSVTMTEVPKACESSKDIKITAATNAALHPGPSSSAAAITAKSPLQKLTSEALTAVGKVSDSKPVSRLASTSCPGVDVKERKVVGAEKVRLSAPQGNGSSKVQQAGGNKDGLPPKSKQQQQQQQLKDQVPHPSRPASVTQKAAHSISAKKRLLEKTDALSSKAEKQRLPMIEHAEPSLKTRKLNDNAGTHSSTTTPRQLVAPSGPSPSTTGASRAVVVSIPSDSPKAAGGDKDLERGASKPSSSARIVSGTGEAPPNAGPSRCRDGSGAGHEIAASENEKARTPGLGVAEEAKGAGSTVAEEGKKAGSKVAEEFKGTGPGVAEGTKGAGPGVAHHSATVITSLKSTISTAPIFRPPVKFPGVSSNRPPPPAVIMPSKSKTFLDTVPLLASSAADTTLGTLTDATQHQLSAHSSLPVQPVSGEESQIYKRATTPGDSHELAPVSNVQSEIVYEAAPESPVSGA
ncbi:hypothetical protein CEUSTIGMA_g770.t1 [Chlamydomonas eustigma]|uniref:Uncharacterized protein n=1 Tax=Chlamydomonas eustigma TaxID=1157962 RepID=A0A250WRI8_9CHLO|nr:hypothetical protein CEUSTIGMA_g770.t1 [Chlamydomonas eustigma]|eukprot:GAX73316.1 hypothetical protein CEUSTIGMA_g770.t1 [Chlamydomonas eustigma]